MALKTKKILSNCAFVVCLTALFAGVYWLGFDQGLTTYSDEPVNSLVNPPESTQPTLAVVEEPVVLDEVPGALQRPPMFESDIGIDKRVLESLATTELGTGTSNSASASTEAPTSIEQIDITWVPGEFIRNICVETFAGISRLCIDTTVGVSIDGSEDLVYEASADNPMAVSASLWIDTPQGDCQSVLMCFETLAIDPPECARVIEDLYWLAWQLGIYSAYNNGVPYLTEYPQDWIVPHYYDGDGDNLLLDISSDCTVTATQS